MEVRKARTGDVTQMMELIHVYAAQGLMLMRSRSSIYETLRDFTVVEDQGNIVAVGALCILWEDLAEVRSLAVAESHTGKGLGTMLVQVLLSEAEELNLLRVFALTYRTRFFEQLGFTVVRKETLPQKVWKDCVNCPKFACCDEVAVLKRLSGSAVSLAAAPASLSV